MKIRIKNLRLRTIIGIFDWEKKRKQDVIVNIAMDFDGAMAQKSDDIAHTINYKQVRNQVSEYIENNEFDLIEKVTGDVADLILKNHELVTSVQVEIDKPGVLRFADSVSVECVKSR